MLNEHEILVYTGGAVGVDHIAADCCIELGIPYIIVLPFPPEIFTARWPANSRVHLRFLMSKASDVVILDDHFSFEGYQRRNEYMVDRADIVVAYWDGSRGGTANTVGYARRKGVPVMNLYPQIHPEKSSG